MSVIPRTSPDLEIRREFAMPNANTFRIPPIRKLVKIEMAESDGIWIDPFANESDFGDVTNDLNPEFETDYHLDAVDFLQKFDDHSIDGGVLFDPPYSPRQIKEVYDRVGLETEMETTQAKFWADCKNEIRRVCAPGATVLTFGWNSGGVGKTKDFTQRFILLVHHGGWHNDTICVVEDYFEAEGSVQRLLGEHG